MTFTGVIGTQCTAKHYVLLYINLYKYILDMILAQEVDPGHKLQ